MAPPPNTSLTTLDALLRRLVEAGPADLAHLKREADRWRRTLAEAKRAEDGLDGGRTASKSTYDQWVLELFQATDTAMPAEALVRGFAERFAAVHELTPPGRGPWLLAWAGYPPHGGSPWYFELVAHAGLTDKQVRHYEHSAQADALSQNRLLQHAFDPDAEAIDLWYLPYYREEMEAGLFDPLFGLKQTQGRAVSGNGFVTAQPLMDDSGRVAHVVVVVYPNKAALYDVRQRPSGAVQDQRALHILAPAYRQLSALNRTLAEDVARMKRDMVAQIGLGLLHHEVGGMVNVLRERLKSQQEWVKLLRARFEELPREFEVLFESLEVADAHAQHLARTTDAFNHLEKGGTVQTFRLQSVFDQVDSLTTVRRGTIGVSLEVESTALTLHNDAVLLLHALLNLVTNALNAFEEADARRTALQPRGAARRIRLRAALDPALPEVLRIEAANNGPPIPADFLPRLFQRGATTRAQGHGQGLYLVRRIAQYCGGDASLIASFLTEETVCFQLLIALRLDAKLQLGLVPVKTSQHRGKHDGIERV